MIGKKLGGRYEVLSELGRGGMGVVYRARDPQLGREVAVKLIAPSLLTPETERRFQSEAQVVAQMDHPSIVSIHDFGRHEGALFFVMPVVEGQSLRHMIRDQSLLLGEILDIGIGVAEALEYSQAHGVVHRDIKPENVMVSRVEGSRLRVRAMDFGLARASEVTRMTKTGVMVGTMSYISPEQATGKTVDTRSDIYSLGTVLYECVTGEVPFTGELQAVVYRVVHETPQSPRGRGVEIDEELDGIILSCLAKDPTQRPQEAAELVRSLRRYRANLRESSRNRSIMVTRALIAAGPVALPFVGRKKEFDELQHRLHAAVAGKCQFVVVSGEAGSGKTRLLDELEKLAQARQIRTLHGRFVEQDGALSYHGFCEAVEEYFQQKETVSASSAQPDFSDLSAELISLFPMLSEIEALRSTSSSGSRLAAAGAPHTPENRTQIFELLARTLTRLAAGKPLLLLLEDLHGGDASLEALQYIVRRLSATPTLIVGTYRSTEIGRRHPLVRMMEGFRGDRRFHAIALQPLRAAAHRELLSTLIDGGKFADDLARRLLDATEGNPFFTKELVRSLVDAGSILRDESGLWALSGETNISSVALPGSIQQAVEERIGRLPDHLRDILSIAAVMGKSFDSRDLEALAPDEGDMDEAIERLIQDGLIKEERQSRGDTLTFVSGVVREVLYAELSRRKRRTTHRKYAALLERRHTGKLERVYPQLVQHCSEGDLPEKSVEYGLKHARRSLEAFSPEEAIGPVKTALDFLDDEWEGSAAAEGEARRLLPTAYQMAGEVGSALKEIAAAVSIYQREGQMGQALDALLLAARTAWQARRTEEARDWVEKGLEAARGTGEEEKLAPFLSLAATLANLRGEYERARGYLEEASRMAGVAEDGGAVEEIPRGGTLVVALANPVTASEPAAMQTLEEWETFSNVFEPLMGTDGEGNLVPLLCEKWEPSDQGRSFVFSLRASVRFQDGHPLTAAAAKAAFERTIRESATDLAPAFAPIEGVAAFLAGRSDSVAGLEVLPGEKLAIRLSEPLPIYPALLTDARTSLFHIQADASGPSLVGTGPFRPGAREEGRIVLERNAVYWGKTPPRLDAVEFRHGLSAASIAPSLKSGEIDLSGDLLPQDLEDILAHPQLGRGLVETSKMTTYFIVFNSHPGFAAAQEEVRRALSGVVRARDLVWQTLGRFAQPAVGLLPPGMLGHDPGRRRRLLSNDEARSLLRKAGSPDSLTLRAAVHPAIQDRYGALLEALILVWEEIGARLQVETPDMASFMRTWGSDAGLDAGIMRWTADYNDPDNFTHNLFHSATGQLRGYYSSPETDEILVSARSETRPASREDSYRVFENHLLDTGLLVPLFHDVDYRVAGPRVRGLAVRNAYPAVNYAELGKAQTAAPAAVIQNEEGGTIHVPMSARLDHLDPAFTDSLEETEVLPSIYETLTRVQEARIEPFLARAFRTGESGKKYSFRLRDDVRFHDGRRLTSRDVRHSFERLLQNDANLSRGQYSAIRGAPAILAGKTTDLAGFRIHSALEFTIELEQAVSFFPVLISYPAACIVPEGTGRIGTSRQEGAVGTGPYRVLRFEPGRRLELERNPVYWRQGYPRNQKLEFHFQVAPDEILSGFRGGRFSLATDLLPADVEELRRDAGFAAGYREAPSLSTYFALLNIHRGPLRDIAQRRRLVAAAQTAPLVRPAPGPARPSCPGVHPSRTPGIRTRPGTGNLLAWASGKGARRSHGDHRGHPSHLHQRIRGLFREPGPEFPLGKHHHPSGDPLHGRLWNGHQRGIDRHRHRPLGGGLSRRRQLRLFLVP
ncbi:MAG: ABC transporter substrate-binding protein [Acidobacteriota bacterium]